MKRLLILSLSLFHSACVRFRIQLLVEVTSPRCKMRLNNAAWLVGVEGGTDGGLVRLPEHVCSEEWMMGTFWGNGSRAAVTARLFLFSVYDHGRYIDEENESNIPGSRVGIVHSASPGKASPHGAGEGCQITQWSASEEV